MNYSELALQSFLSALLAVAKAHFGDEEPIEVTLDGQKRRISVKRSGEPIDKETRDRLFAQVDIQRVINQVHATLAKRRSEAFYAGALDWHVALELCQDTEAKLGHGKILKRLISAGGCWEPSEN